MNAEEKAGVADVSDVFRSANEHVDALNWTAGDETPNRRRVAYVCECDDLACMEHLELTQVEYAAVRAHSHRYVVAAAHTDQSGHLVVARADSFVVVEKVPANPRQLALLDPLEQLPGSHGHDERSAEPH